MKRRYQNPNYLTLRHRLFGFMNFHYVLNLFVAYRAERRHFSGKIRYTPRYRAWLAKRDAA